MSSVLYYSGMCQNCQQLLQLMSSNNLGSDIHFICIDKRVQKNNQTFVVLANQQEVLLPNQIDKVPALLLLNDNFTWKDIIITFSSNFNHIESMHKV